MNLDAISASLNGAARRKAEIGDGPAHFLGRQRARRGNVLHPCCGERSAGDAFTSAELSC